MISTKNHGGWGVCISRETINLSNAPIPGSSGVESRETQQEGSRSPLPGPSGVERRKFTTQATATISVPPDRQEQQTQQKVSKSPGSGGPGRSSYAYGSSFPSFPRATVFVLPERRGKQTQQRKNSSSVPSEIESREPTTQAVATVSVPPDRQKQQTQQRSRSPLRETAGLRHSVIYPIPLYPQATATVSAPVEQIQQRRSNHVPGPSGLSFYHYPQHGPWPFSGGYYPYGSPFSPCPHPSARQDQWRPFGFFPSPFFSVRPLVAVFDPLRYEIPVQKEGVGHSGRAEEASTSVPVGAVQQTPIWRLDEESSSAKVLPQAQADNSDKDTDVDVKN